MGNTLSGDVSSVYDSDEEDFHDTSEEECLREAAGGTTDTEEPEPVIDQCGLEPGEWVEVFPDPRIKESRLTAEEKTKFRGHLAIIFGEDALFGRRLVFHPDDVVDVMEKVVPYLKSEPMLIEDVPNDVVIVGDLHGQLLDLYRIFVDDEKDGKPGWENMRYVFLGNYVSKGRQSLEIAMGLFCLKMLYPDRIFLLRGKQEFMINNGVTGFYLEIEERYEDEETVQILYAYANTAFCWLSVAAIVGNKYYCAHGGISTAGNTRLMMRRLTKPYIYSDSDIMAHDTIFSSPAEGLRGTARKENGSFYFGPEELAYALQNMECVALFRGDTLLEAGYEKFCDLGTSLFSASGQSGTNKGAVAHVGPTGAVNMRIQEVDPACVAWDAKLLLMDRMNAQVEEGDKIGTGAIPTIVA